MLIRTCKSSPVLAAFVDYYWYLESNDQMRSMEMSLPDGSIDIVIDLLETSVTMIDATNRTLSLSTPLVCGPHSNYFVIVNSVDTAVIGIHFKPGGAFPFLGIPLNELHNQLVSLDRLWGNKAGELRDTVLECNTIEQKFRVLDTALTALIEKTLKPPIPVVQYMLAQLDSDVHSTTIQQIVERLSISHRHMIALNKQETGFTPNGYRRIRRFQEVLRLLNASHEIDWMEIALSCGYYDQAHFIKDFRAFSGLRPSEYKVVSGKHHNHVYVHK